MAVENKVWGTKTKVWETDGIVVELLEILPGGFCSVHQHDYLKNYFYVLEGMLEISIFSLDDIEKHMGPQLIQKKNLTTNMSLVMPNRIIHQFRNPQEIQPTRVIEVTYLGNNFPSVDIERFSEGGIDG